MTEVIIPLEYLPGRLIFLSYCTVYMLSRNYLSMVNHCEWCKGEIRDKRTKLCSGCRLLSPGFIGTDISPFLSYRRNIDTNQILAPARGLSDGQRIKHLTQEVDLRIPIPPILRSKRKGGLNSINYDPNDWKKMKDYWDRFGSIRRGNYFFPDGSFLTVNNNGVFHINGQQLTGNLPILDIAEWLSNPLRSESIRFWDELILLLDCTMTKLPIAYRNEEDWAIWVDENSWRGIDYPWKTARTFPPPTSRIPPFLQYIYEKNKSKYFDGEKLTINKSIPEVIRDNFEDLELKSYGVIGKNWAKIFKINNHSTEYRKKTVPILIVSDYRFKLFVIKDKKPATFYVGNDPRDWRVLLTWALLPHGTSGSELIQGLLMNWEKEEEIWHPSKRQLVSARLLHDEITKLGGNSSLSPLEYDESTPGLFVKGESGFSYVISPTSEMKLKVDVLPSASEIHNASSVGIDLCIDPIILDDIPFGDVAVSYLMALHNDLTSRKYIFTLDIFMKSVEQNDKKLEDEDYWETVEELYGVLLEEIHTGFPFEDDERLEAEIEQFEREQLAISIHEEYEYEQEMERRMEEERERLEEQLAADYDEFCRNIALQGDGEFE